MHQPPVSQGADDTPPPAAWRVHLLGGLELSDGRQRLTRLPSRAHVALLARLALQPQRAHAREELIELLWPGVALDVGRNRMRQVLSTLRTVLEPPGHAPVLDADRTSLRVRPGALACDVLQFEKCLREGHTAQALTWYRGELLPGYYDDWIDSERNRLAALHERWCDAPLPLLQPGAAGAAPAFAPATAATAATAAPAAAPTTPVFTDMARASLPHYLTPLFGSEAALEALRAQVRSARLVSLLGPGGSGKTRLAVELAHRLSALDGDGAASTRPFRPGDVHIAGGLHKARRCAGRPGRCTASAGPGP